jgi:hypothetical protein
MCLFCFSVLSCECIFLCVLCCLMFIDMLHVQMQLIQRLDQWNELYVCIFTSLSLYHKVSTQIVPKLLHWRLVCFDIYDAYSCMNPWTIMWAYTGHTIISVQCNIGIMNWGLLQVVEKKTNIHISQKLWWFWLPTNAASLDGECKNLSYRKSQSKTINSWLTG